MPWKFQSMVGIQVAISTYYRAKNALSIISLSNGMAKRSENMERERGVEPPYQAWEAVLRLSLQNLCAQGDPPDALAHQASQVFPFEAGLLNSGELRKPAGS